MVLLVAFAFPVLYYAPLSLIEWDLRHKLCKYVTKAMSHTRSAGPHKSLESPVQEKELSVNDGTLILEIIFTQKSLQERTSFMFVGKN